MRHTFQTLALAVLASASVSTQTPPQTPVKIDGTGGARTAKQTRPPDNRRPRGTAVGLLGWRAGIRSDAFGAMPFLDAAARIDAAGVAFVEGGQHESRLQTRRGRAGNHQGEAHRSRSARSRVSYRRDSRRRRIPQQAARFREGARNRAHHHEAAGESCGHQGRCRRCARHVQRGRDDARRKSSRRRKIGAAAARAEQAAAARGARMAEQVHRLRHVAPVEQAALLYDRSRRRRELRQGRPRGAGLSRQRDLPDAADHDGRSHSGRRKAEDRRGGSAAGARQAAAGEKAAHHRCVSRRRLLPQHRRPRESDAAAHREIHRRVRADLRQQPREPAISAHQAVRRGISQQRRRARCSQIRKCSTD